MKQLVLLAGARPNYMKIFPIWRALRSRNAKLRPVLVHTGQHYDEIMSDAFFRDLELPPPDHFLGVGSGPHGAQTARAMIALEELFMQNRPDGLVVVGDVNSTVAGALVGVKMGIPVAHVEAGLRSFDRSMPEEINRIVTDAISDLLLTSCRDADENLLREGIPQERIHFVGNVMIDSLVQVLPRAAASDLLNQLGLQPGAYVAVTLHRPSNVDDPRMLTRILDALAAVATTTPVVFPIHPRTRKMIELSDFRSQVSGLKFLAPLGYLDFLRLESQAALVITDSGGIQEETSYLGIPCITVRPNTERPITITQGTNILHSNEVAALPDVAARALAQPRRPPPQIEKWDGHAAERIVEILEKTL